MRERERERESTGSHKCLLMLEMCIITRANIHKPREKENSTNILPLTYTVNL